MKNMRGRFLRKLKTISTPTWNSSLVFQANAPVQAFHCLPTLSSENFGLSETPVDVKEEEADGGEKVVPSIISKEGNADASESKPGEIVAVSTRDRAQLSVDHDTSTDDHVNKEQVEDKEELSQISDFEERCPPEGKDSVVLYTTSLRGIRKTFEDGNTIRFLLESFRVVYSERDVSMHLEYREELWRILGGRVVPPRLFIRGRYIGGADEVVGLHEKGMLQNLLQGIPLSPSRNPCRGCGGVRFVLCGSCNGSRKVMPEGRNDGGAIRCPDCNENGLIKCSICS